jgi:hypothetical protein
MSRTRGNSPWPQSIAMFHVADRPAGLACVQCACFEVAERDGMWAGGEVAQPRKAPPDLGTNCFDAATITEATYTNAAVRAIRFPFACIAHTGFAIRSFRGPYRHLVHGLTKSLLSIN